MYSISLSSVLPSKAVSPALRTERLELQGVPDALLKIPCRDFSEQGIYSSSRNTRVFRHEIRAQSETCLHREYNLAMKNKASGGSQTCAVEGAYAPRTSRQERRGVFEIILMTSIFVRIVLIEQKIRSAECKETKAPAHPAHYPFKHVSFK